MFAFNDGETNCKAAHTQRKLVYEIDFIKIKSGFIENNFFLIGGHTQSQMKWLF